jgi:hypothetical protein
MYGGYTFRILCWIKLQGGVNPNFEGAITASPNDVVGQLFY